MRCSFEAAPVDQTATGIMQSTKQLLISADHLPIMSINLSPLLCLFPVAVYLFMRWLYVRLGITSSVAAAAGAARSPAAVLGVGDSDSDNLLDSQLEMSDYVATGISDTSRMRDVSKLKGTRDHNT